MKVLALNGSSNGAGNTYGALRIVADALEKEDISTEIVTVGDRNFKGCTGCHSCKKTGSCVLPDPGFPELLNKMHEADGLLLGSPVYYGGISGAFKSFLDRAFFSTTKGQLRLKPAASVVVLRRTGAISAYEELNHFLLAHEMILVPSGWNAVFGANPGEILSDLEGVQRLKKLGRNMAWLLKMIELTKKTLTPPEPEERIFFNFIR